MSFHILEPTPPFIPSGPVVGVPGLEPPPGLPPRPQGGGGILGTIFQGLGGFAGLGKLGLGILTSILNRPRAAQQNPLFNAQLQKLLAFLTQQVKADPRVLSSLLSQAARGAQGARTRVQKQFSGRGLGRSGLAQDVLSRIETDLLPQLQQSAQSEALGIARGERNVDLQAQLGALSLIPTTLQRGQSIPGAFTGGLFQTLLFLLGQQAGAKQQAAAGGG